MTTGCAFAALAPLCEMCFGSAADSPTVAAIFASMLLLLVLTGGVLGGITVFFTRTHAREAVPLAPASIPAVRAYALEADSVAPASASVAKAREAVSEQAIGDAPQNPSSE